MSVSEHQGQSEPLPRGFWVDPPEEIDLIDFCREATLITINRAEVKWGCDRVYNPLVGLLQEILEHVQLNTELHLAVR